MLIIEVSGQAVTGVKAALFDPARPNRLYLIFSAVNAGDLVDVEITLTNEKWCTQGVIIPKAYSGSTVQDAGVSSVDSSSMPT
jgi:hypothetical protein